jgi:hypothetical protein
MKKIRFFFQVSARMISFYCSITYWNLVFIFHENARVFFYFDKPTRGNNEISNGNSLNVHRYSLLCCINLSTVWPLLSFKHSVVAFPIVLEARSYITVARMVISCLCICHICRRQWIRNRSTQECRNWKVTYLACIYFSFVALGEVYLRSWRIHSFSWLALALCFFFTVKTYIFILLLFFPCCTKNFFLGFYIRPSLQFIYLLSLVSIALCCQVIHTFSMW